jgi:hypothetical protein
VSVLSGEGAFAWSFAFQLTTSPHSDCSCCEVSRRDYTTVAWHEVPGTEPPQKSRPVGTRSSSRQFSVSVGSGEGSLARACVLANISPHPNLGLFQFFDSSLTTDN